MRTTCCRAAWTPPARMRVLTGVRYAFARTIVRALDAAMEAREQPAAFGIGADEAGEPRAAAERGDVVRGVAGAAGDHLGRVVLEDQHRRLARHARDLAVDELVGDEVADDQHAAAAEAVDEREQAFLALGLAGQRVNGSGYEHRPSIQLAAAIRLSTTASAVRSSRRLVLFRHAVSGPHQDASRPDRARQRRRRPTGRRRRTTARDRCRTRATARSTRPRPGLRQSHAARSPATLPSGMVRTIVIRVDVGAALGQHLRHVPVHLVDDRLGEEAARDARLIRDHHDGEAGAIERADGVDRPRIELDALGAIEIPDFFDDRAVAIEKHRAPVPMTVCRRSQHPPASRRARAAAAMPCMHA